MCVDKQISESSDKKSVGYISYPKKSKFTTYSIKKVLMSIFKKHVHDTSRKATFMLSTSVESLENIRNSQFEDHYEEIEDNTANEKLLSCLSEEVQASLDSITWTFQQGAEGVPDVPDYACPKPPRRMRIGDQPDVFVPVRFARTDAGTFFWTTSLKPIAADGDLIQPLQCSSADQRPQLQFQDRWAQA